MPRKLITLWGLVALSACSGSAPATEVAEETPGLDVATADSKSQFAGAWTLVKIERFDADGELLAPPIEDRLGYIIYDPAGYMGVTIMQPDRQPYSNPRTSEEVLDAYATYTSYFGTFTVNEAEGFLTHHLEGSLNTRGAGSDYKRFYTFSGNRLTLQPPAAANGDKSQLTWEKLPDLPESELTETHRRLFGFYRIESVSRQIVGGESLPANQYETAFIIYAPSGHMAVHLMRPGREPYAGTLTPEDALAAVQTYGSYFGPFSVHEDEGYLVHQRIGNLSPRRTYTDAQRFYELTDTHLTLLPPAGTNSEGRRVQSALRWVRISD
ncbi:MAG: lipocalin-like domain-containing protein [Gemmatimonadetes bacterium]|nr:lipocalin-like domain-containing protein [Gemmatimonadota bacterium]